MFRFPVTLKSSSTRSPIASQIAAARTNPLQGHSSKNILSRFYSKSPNPQDLFEWAKNKGAYTYTHWFSTLRGVNGEKHDTLEYPFDDSHPTYDKTAFSQNVFAPKAPFAADSSHNKLWSLLQNMNRDYKKLHSGESDGSSFPSGGLRETHRAGGYTIRDSSSPPFVYNKTLYLPSMFVSYCGEPLDEKTPLLRSQDAINTQGSRLLKALGYRDEAESGVVTNVGWEQEFFVVDRDLYYQRPDLVQCGRSLVGCLPHRNQQTNANYFARQPPRIRQYLDKVRDKLWELGIPISTAHSEVAPGQYEISPVFTMSSISADQNLISMEVMRDLAEEFNVAVLFHEKPFEGINGSGKHANWGLNVKDTGENLMVPGKTPDAQRRFMVMMAAMTRAVDLHADVLRAVIGSAGNDHRLGAQEAPPAIVSVYTGEALESHIKKIIQGGKLEGYSASDEVQNMSLAGIDTDFKKPKEDRNRTSPFPFCLNRFEFRAVGSAQTLASPVSYLNAMVAESLGYVADEIENGKDVRDVVANIFKEHKRVIFNGDGYSDAWVREAEQRGLPHLNTTVDALKIFTSDKNKRMLEKTNVLSSTGLEARCKVYYHMYNEQILMEANCMRDMIHTGILPAAIRDFRNLSNSEVPGLSKLKTQKVSAIESLTREVDALDELVKDHESLDNTPEQAEFAASRLLPQMQKARQHADEVEALISSSEYPFPKYSDLLFKLNMN